jgi:hypothetical protein
MITRRKFLSGLGLALATGLGGYALVTDSKWAFVEAEPTRTTPVVSLEEIQSRAILVTNTLLPDSSQESQDAREALMPQIRNFLESHAFKGDFNAVPRKLVYQIPETRKGIVRSCLEYCQDAQDFLHKKIKGLSDERVIWTITQNTPTDPRGKGFIGQGHYPVIEVTLREKENGKEHAKFYRWPNQIDTGGLAITGAVATGSKNWAVLLSTGRYSLVAPFSELIHLSAAPAAERYAKTKGDLESHRADESLAEGLALVLAKDLTQKLNAPGRERVLNEILANYFDHPVYDRVPNAIRWIERNGAQQAYDLFQEDPGQFMSAIAIE